jgi:hypothetical protein
MTRPALFVFCLVAASAGLRGQSQPPAPDAAPTRQDPVPTGKATDGKAAALLVAPEGRHGACLEWRADTLPCFSLWKNQGGLADGYVTGLEPATNYPNPRSFEEAQGRVVPLGPQQSVRFELALEHLSAAGLVARRAAIGALAAAPQPTIHRQPRPGWSAG